MSGRIYLDWAATAPLHPAAREAMMPWLDHVGNPSSLYLEGREARAAVDQARETLSGALGCEFGEVTFTGSGSEAVNLAIVGLALANRGSGRRRVLMSGTEHHCVLNTRKVLESLGFQIELLPVNQNGLIQQTATIERFADDVLLVSCMRANNETGAMQPVSEVFAAARDLGIVGHCDAVQSFLTLPDNVDTLGADLVSVSAHKVGGPKGVGALYVRAGTRLQPLICGGGQEREMRAGTENVAGIVGFAAAVAHYSSGGKEAARDGFVQELDRLTSVEWTLASGTPTLPGHAHCSLPDISAESMLIVLDRMGVSASSGAACSSGSIEPSHVLLAMGWSLERARRGLRFTFGPSTTLQEAQEAARRCAEAASQIRATRKV